MAKKSELKFEITQHCVTLSESPNGWRKELNLVKWNDNDEKFDIRSWSSDHTKMGKGATFTKKEAAVLRDMLNEMIL